MFPMLFLGLVIRCANPFDRPEITEIVIVLSFGRARRDDGIIIGVWIVAQRTAVGDVPSLSTSQNNETKGHEL